MAVSITYNSQSLANQIGRISFQRDKGQAVFSIEFAPASSDVESVITALKKWDKTLVISTANWSQTFKLNDNSGALAYVTCRTSVEKAGISALDNTGRKRLRFTAIIELQSVDDDGFRDWSADCDTDAQGRKVVTVTGVVTGSGSTSAKDQFENNIAAIENAYLTLWGGTYEKPVTRVASVDRYTGRHVFSRTHVQLLEVNNVKSSGTESRDTDIIFPTFSIRRSTQLERGRAHPHVKFFAVRWSATFSVGKTGIISLWDTTIRALLVARINSQFGNSRSLVMVQDEIDYSSTEQSASGQWVVRAAGGDTVSYVEEIEAPFKVADYDQVMNGVDFNVEAYGAGIIMEIIQNVVHVQQGSAPPIPPAPIVSGLVAGAKLVLLEGTPKWGSTRRGVSSGSGGDTVDEVEDHTLTWKARYVVRKKPEGSPVPRPPSGAKGGTLVDL